MSYEVVIRFNANNEAFCNGDDLYMPEIVRIIHDIGKHIDGDAIVDHAFRYMNGKPVENTPDGKKIYDANGNCVGFYKIVRRKN